MVVPGFLKTWLNSSLSWRPLFYKAIIRPKAACLAGVPRGQVLSLFLSQIPRSLNIPFVLARLLAVVSSPLATLLFAQKPLRRRSRFVGVVVVGGTPLSLDGVRRSSLASLPLVEPLFDWSSETPRVCIRRALCALSLDLQCMAPGRRRRYGFLLAA